MSAGFRARDAPGRTAPRRRFHETRCSGRRCDRAARARGVRRCGLVVGLEPRQAHATTLTVWVGWSARELSEFKKVGPSTTRRTRTSTSRSSAGSTTTRSSRRCASGNAPDVVSSFTSSNVGIYCSSGGWIDLSPYMKQDKITPSIFPAATMYYTQYKGTRCALPLLADVYGFYYNKALFKTAGLTHPPRTLAELTAVREEADEAQRATGRSRSSASTPCLGFYQNAAGALSAARRRRSTSTPTASRSLSSRSGVAEAADVAEEPDRLYGYNKLVKWQTGAGDEFSASHAFETRQARDDDGRRVARRVHRGRAPGARSTAPRRCRWTTPGRTSTAPATSTARSSASRRTARTVTRPGSSSST